MSKKFSQSEKIIRTPKKVKEYRKALFTSCSITPDNKDEIEKAASFLAELFISQIDAVIEQKTDPRGPKSLHMEQKGIEVALLMPLELKA